MDLNLGSSTSAYQGKSRIRLLLSAPESTKAVGAAIVNARKDTNTVGIGEEKTVVGYSDGALDLVDKASKLSALSNVLDKVDIFVKIVDKTASVRG